MSPFMDVAVAAAQAAAEDIMCHYRGDFEVEFKADQTPVTVADRRAEQTIRCILLEAFPDHGFFGEEGGGQWVWTPHRYWQPHPDCIPCYSRS